METSMPIANYSMPIGFNNSLEVWKLDLRREVVDDLEHSFNNSLEVWKRRSGQ